MSQSHSHSPPEMAQPRRDSSIDSMCEHLRKRVGKACDRCRMKKSKCDGVMPCGRCRGDNAICQFGEKKKQHDKIHPKGYVEVLERQQAQLVHALQKMYRMLADENLWPGGALSTPDEPPLTHHILAALGLLGNQAGNDDMDDFEEDTAKLEAKLYKAGAPNMQRSDSVASDSARSQPYHTSTAHTTPNMVQPGMFLRDLFNYSAPSTPLTQTPPTQQRHSYPSTQPAMPLGPTQPPHDPRFYQARFPMPVNEPQAIVRGGFSLQQTPLLLQNYPDEIAEMMDSNGWTEPINRYDTPVEMAGPNLSTNSQPNFPPNFTPNFPEYTTALDSDDDFAQWVQVHT